MPPDARVRLQIRLFYLSFFTVSSGLLPVGSKIVRLAAAQPVSVTNRFDEFRKFVKKELRPAMTDIAKLVDANRKHVQKLVYTNLVDRFDAMVDEAILENCRKEHLVEEAMKGMTQPFTEADVLRLLMQGQSIQDTIDARLRDVLRIAVIRQRHSKKLAILFKVLKPDEESWNKPRVNIATGQILEEMTPQRKTISYSVCGYADWLYSRRNSIVHGGGTAKLLANDAKQIEALFKCKPAKTFKIKLSSIKNTATFYESVVHLLTA